MSNISTIHIKMPTLKTSQRTRPCSQDGKKVVESRVVKKRGHQKGREALIEEFETLFIEQNCHNGQVGPQATLRNAKPRCSTQFSGLGCRRKHSQA